MNRKGLLVVISGFAGAGKGTVIGKLTEQYEGYSLSISATSRSPRPGEKEGVNYFFKSRAEFEKMIANNELLEYAEYVSNYYGTPRAFVEKELVSGRNVLLEIEIQGAMQIKKAFPHAVLIFILPPSAEELKRRLTGRGTETEDVIISRMKRAVEESQGIEEYDYIVVNGSSDKCAEELHGIINAAAHTPERNSAFIERIRRELKEQ